MASTTRLFPYADLGDPADAQASMLELAQFLDDFGAKYLMGAIGDRPAAAAVNEGTFYISTEPAVYVSNGAGWITVSADLTNYARKDLTQTFTKPQQVNADTDPGIPLKLKRNSITSTGDLLQFLDELDAVLSSIGSSGRVRAPAGTAALPGHSFQGDTDSGLYAPGGDQLAIATAGAARELITALVHRFKSDTVLGWSSGDPASLASDTILYRRIADILRTDDTFEASVALDSPLFRYLTDPTRNLRFGTGSPEGAVTASPGSVYLRIDGAPWSYTKTSGTGNTGWTANTLYSKYDEVHADVADGPLDATQVTLYSESLAAGDMSVGAVFRLKVAGEYLNNSGADRTWTIRIKLGATTILTWVFTATSSAKRRWWTLGTELTIEAAALQRLHSFGVVTIGADPGVMDNASQSNSQQGLGYGTAAEDTSSAKNLIVTAQHSVSHASVSALLHTALLERIA